jgi:hypothetical protein
MRRPMPDDDDRLPVALGGELIEERAHPCGGVVVALPAGEGTLDAVRAGGSDRLTWRTRQFAVVALTQARVLDQRDATVREGDARGLARSLQVGAVDGVERPPGQLVPQFGERDIEVARGDAASLSRLVEWLTKVIAGDITALQFRGGLHLKGVRTLRCAATYRVSDVRCGGEQR